MTNDHSPIRFEPRTTSVEAEVAYPVLTVRGQAPAAMNVVHGDCLEVMAAMEPESVDAVVTDPPYSIGFMSKKWDQHLDEDAAFGYWLAGFTDGEGHFRVQEQARGTYSCAFSIHLRRDDRAILERIRRFLGCGSVIDEKDTETRNPMSRINVQAKADCLRVVEVFTRYPLRAKKLRDFLPWAEAVLEWNEMKRGHRWSGRSDWSRLEALKVRVESARAFRDVPWSGNGYQDWSREWGELALRVMKPGSYLLAMGGTRTYHRMVTGLEDAGFEIRDCLVWAYASGFPKSKASLKPAWEPIVMARKPGPLRMLAIDECRIGPPLTEAEIARSGTSTDGPFARGGLDWKRDGHEPLGRWPANVILTDPIFDGDVDGVVGGGETVSNVRVSEDFDEPGATWSLGRSGITPRGVSDSGTYSRFFILPKADRQDREPVLEEYAYRLHRERGECDKLRTWASADLSRSDPTGSTSPGRATSGATSTDDSSSGTSQPGSPPTDPSPTATRSTTSTATRPTTGSTTSSSSIPSPTSASTPGASSETANGGSPAASADGSSLWAPPTGISVQRAGHSTDDAGPATSGSSSSRNVCGRCGKPLPRVGSHPTVKPTELMRHLVRLVTPAGGTVLDPFLGSGTTGLACELEGFPWIGIEKEAEYVAIAEARLNGTQRGMGLSA